LEGTRIAGDAERKPARDRAERRRVQSAPRLPARARARLPAMRRSFEGARSELGRHEPAPLHELIAEVRTTNENSLFRITTRA